MLTIDYREKALRHVLVDVQHETRNLPVGDVLCEYGDSHAPWIAERKSGLLLIAGGAPHRIRCDTPLIPPGGGPTRLV